MNQQIIYPTRQLQTTNGTQVNLEHIAHYFPYVSNKKVIVMDPTGTRMVINKLLKFVPYDVAFRTGKYDLEVKRIVAGYLYDYYKLESLKPNNFMGPYLCLRQAIRRIELDDLLVEISSSYKSNPRSRDTLDTFFDSIVEGMQEFGPRYM